MPTPPRPAVLAIWLFLYPSARFVAIRPQQTYGYAIASGSGFGALLSLSVTVHCRRRGAAAPTGPHAIIHSTVQVRYLIGIPFTRWVGSRLRGWLAFNIPPFNVSSGFGFDGGAAAQGNSSVKGNYFGK